MYYLNIFECSKSNSYVEFYSTRELAIKAAEEIVKEFTATSGKSEVEWFGDLDCENPETTGVSCEIYYGKGEMDSLTIDEVKLTE
jgi:hypothetical protein